MAAEGFSAICDLLKRCWDSTYFVNCRILKNNDEQGICDHPNSFPDSVIGSRNFFSANLTHAITGMWQTGPRNLATFESGLRQKLELWKIKSKSMAVVDIATCYYNEGIEDAFDDYMDYVDETVSEYYEYY